MATRHEARRRLAESGVLVERLLHDLKQPLNLIRIIAQDVLLDIRKDRLDRERLPESMDQLCRAVDEMDVEIDQLRRFATTREDGAGLSTSLNDACRNAVVRLRAAHPGVTLVETLGEALPRVCMDASGLEQAILELLDNGARAALEGGAEDGPRLHVITKEDDRGLLLEVVDNGAGVADEALGKLFDPFFTTRDPAAGLGLPLARAIAAGAGGGLVLAWTGKEGSRFELTLPGGGQPCPG